MCVLAPTCCSATGPCIAQATFQLPLEGAFCISGAQAFQARDACAQAQPPPLLVTTSHCPDLTPMATPFRPCPRRNALRVCYCSYAQLQQLHDKWKAYVAGILPEQPPAGKANNGNNNGAGSSGRNSWAPGLCILLNVPSEGSFVPLWRLSDLNMAHLTT